MKTIILAVAEQELSEAITYYNLECPGLGYELAIEAKESLNRINSFPEAWPPFSRTTRRCLINRFPYGILYRKNEDEIIVYSIMHLKRNPENWFKRLEKYLSEQKDCPNR
ncbi:MAG: type II toxin-antitoxin system RelE/ParE family toxin [Lentisphaerota bacterium]